MISNITVNEFWVIKYILEQICQIWSEDFKYRIYLKILNILKNILGSQRSVKRLFKCNFNQIKVGVMHTLEIAKNLNDPYPLL